jgi:hypothetical protein
MGKVIPITKKLKALKKPKLGPQGLALLVVCKGCGHRQIVKPAVVLPELDGNARCIYGSDADFCRKCDGQDVRIESAPRKK